MKQTNLFSGLVILLAVVAAPVLGGCAATVSDAADEADLDSDGEAAVASDQGALTSHGCGFDGGYYGNRLGSYGYGSGPGCGYGGHGGYGYGGDLGLSGRGCGTGPGGYGRGGYGPGYGPGYGHGPGYGRGPGYGPGYGPGPGPGYSGYGGCGR